MPTQINTSAIPNFYVESPFVGLKKALKTSQALSEVFILLYTNSPLMTKDISITISKSQSHVSNLILRLEMFKIIRKVGKHKRLSYYIQKGSVFSDDEYDELFKLAQDVAAN